MEIEGTGLKVHDASGTPRAGQSIDAVKSKLSTDKKNYTACFMDVNGSFGTGKYKGETKAYTQGVYYDSDRSKSPDGKRKESSVSVQFAAESATSLLTTLGAVAFGVAALAF